MLSDSTRSDEMLEQIHEGLLGIGAVLSQIEKRLLATVTHTEPMMRAVLAVERAEKRGRMAMGMSEQIPL